MKVWKIILKKLQGVRELRNIITAEFMKMKKSRMIYVCSLIAFIIPVLIVIKDLFYISSVKRVGMDAWIHSIVMTVLLLVYPVLSGFIITYLIQKEYGDYTIINTLTSSISRTSFLCSKIVVWFIWHFFVALTCSIITCIGCFALFPADFGGAVVLKITSLFLKCSILNFVSLLPLLCIAINQRKVFYPSLLTCLLFAILGVAGTNMPIGLASILPWSAVTVICFNTVNIYYIISIIILSICGLVSLKLSVDLFKKQNI